MQRYSGTPFCHEGKVGDAHSVLLDAAKLVAHAIPLMVHQANGNGAAD
jgi:hypothetical protein